MRISIEVNSAADAEEAVAALKSLLGTLSGVAIAARAADANRAAGAVAGAMEVIKDPAIAGEIPAKRGPGRPKKEAVEAADVDIAPAAAAAAAPAPAPAPAPAVAADGAVDAESFMNEVRKFAQDGKNGGVAKAQAILAQFTQADGKTPCARVNQVQEKDRQGVLDKIRAELAKAKK